MCWDILYAIAAERYVVTLSYIHWIVLKILHCVRTSFPSNCVYERIARTQRLFFFSVIPGCVVLFTVHDQKTISKPFCCISLYILNASYLFPETAQCTSSKIELQKKNVFATFRRNQTFMYLYGNHVTHGQMRISLQKGVKRMFDLYLMRKNIVREETRYSEIQKTFYPLSN